MMAIEILINVVQKLAYAAQILVFASIVISWVRPDPTHPIVRFVHRLTDPAYVALRKMMPFLQAGMIDFTPVALLLLIELLSVVAVRLLQQVALHFA
jgi:YggT family protein